MPVRASSVDGARARVFALVMAFGVPAVALFPLAASGQSKPKAEKPATDKPADRYDSENITALSQFMDTVVKGNQLFLSKDYTGAIDSYKKATQLSPKHALGYYLLAEAYAANNNFTEADAAMVQAQNNTDARDPMLRARVLFLAADLHERQKRWEPAKTAWQAYSEYVSKLGGDGGVFPQTAAERIKALQRVLEMEKAYVGVRQRIAAEKADGGKSPTPPASPPKK